MPSSFRARLRRAVPRLTRRRAIGGTAALVLLAGSVTWATWPDDPSYRTEDRMITVRSGPAGDEPVALDTRIYLPDGASAAEPVPAVLLAHGFGGTKTSVRADAEDLAGRGYAVLTWTARGFGRSGGQIHLNHPDYEVRDAARLLDWLAARPEVRSEAAGDPLVGVVGGSYGGALALLLAAQDPRVDAIVPMITWNDLARAFLPDAVGDDPANGVFKKSWAGLFFGSGTAGAAGAGGPGGSGASTTGQDEGAGTEGAGTEGAGTEGAGTEGAGTEGAGLPTGDRGEGGPAGANPVGSDPACGRFAADVCATYQRIATTGRADAAAIARLRQSSPAPALSRISAPTLLVQGTADTLFPLAEADANARGIAAAGTPVRVAWFTGGHDGGAGPQTDQDRVRFLTAQWLDHYVAGSGDAPASSFTYSRITGFSTLDRGLTSNAYSVTDYPGLHGASAGADPVTVAGPTQRVANPPAGNPAAISSVPLAGALSSLSSGLVMDIPGQHARFESGPLDRPIEVAGSATVSIRAASPTGAAVLFAKLYDVDANGAATLPGGQVAPIKLAGLPADIGQARPVVVTLPAIVHRFEAGHRLRVVLATADQAYATPVQPVTYTVGLSGTPLTAADLAGAGLAGAVPGGAEPMGAALALPTVPGEPIASREVVWRYVLAGLLVAVVVGLAAAVVVARRRHRRADRTVVSEYVDTPLVVRDLRMEYADGFVAVSRVGFEVRRGQVVGLLGPNGAGKTTTLRVLMGLTRPSGGEVLVFGHRLVPGAPVLSRLGALVEGPGFLPHLSGLENLRSYWRATGRPAEQARFEEALEIAGLGDSVHRKIRTYSHGMRQRLAIAQAMLGLPELLVLDEPTDGLDPPQIAEMRRVLRRYATDGRAVLVSSHLLAEVEQTCTHVVVVHKGEVVASGLVDEIVGDSPTVQLEVSDVPAAQAVLDRLSGVRQIGGDGNGGMVVDVDGTPRSELVAELVRAGVGVDRVVPRRRLEDAFLALVGENSRGSGDR